MSSGNPPSSIYDHVRHIHPGVPPKEPYSPTLFGVNTLCYILGYHGPDSYHHPSKELKKKITKYKTRHVFWPGSTGVPYLGAWYDRATQKQLNELVDCFLVDFNGLELWPVKQHFWEEHPKVTLCHAISSEKEV